MVSIATTGLCSRDSHLWNRSPHTGCRFPFRPTEAHDIGEHTEAAFKVIFEEGNYVEADAALATAEIHEANEPLVHALIARYGLL